MQSSFNGDAPPYDEDPPGDDDDVTSDNGDDVAGDEDGDDMYGDLGIEDGNAEDGDADDDHDDNGSASAMLVADDNDSSMETSGKPSTGIIIYQSIKLHVSSYLSCHSAYMYCVTL
jgi:hypothetical protein